MVRVPVAGISVLLAVSVLSACGPRKPAGVAVRSFANDARGACFAERAELDGQGASFETTFAPKESGLRAGPGVGPYLAALLNAERPLAAVVDLINGDIERENLWIGWTVDAFDNLVACRKASALAIRSDRISGRKTPEAAARALNDVRRLYAEDLERFRLYADRIAKNTAQYADLYNDFAEDNAAAPVRARAPAERPAPRKRLVSRGRLAAQHSKPVFRAKLSEMRSVLLTNVRKRDGVFERIEQAKSVEVELDLAGDLPILIDVRFA